MSPRSAAAAVADTLHVPVRTRTRTRPAPPRRRSGAAVRPHAAAPSRRIAVARPAGALVLDRLLRGPAYIALVGVLLAGIVFFNVDVLELNHGIARTDTRAAQLKRENAVLTLQLAKLGSSERIQRVALERGLVLPQPGDVRYLRAHRQDAGRALRVMTAPDSSGAAAAVPGSVAQTSQTAASTTSPFGGQTPAATTTAQPAATTVQTPVSPTPTATTTAQSAAATDQTPTG